MAGSVLGTPAVGTSAPAVCRAGVTSSPVWARQKCHRPLPRDAWRAEPAVLLGCSEVRLLNVKVDVEAVACALSFSFDGDALPGGRQNVV